MIELKINVDSMGELFDEVSRLISGGTPGGAPTGFTADETASEEPTSKPEATEAPETEPEATESSGRLFGKAEDGKSRRTKEQMAEDDEIAALAEELEAKLPADMPATKLLGILKAEQARRAEVEEISGSNISDSPEDRKDPADDAVELTRDDLRAPLMALVERDGMEDAMKTMLKVTGYSKMSDVPETQEALSKALSALQVDLNG